jgi:acetyl esterase
MQWHIVRKARALMNARRSLLGLFPLLVLACEKPKQEPPPTAETRSGEMLPQATVTAPRVEPKDAMKAADGDMKDVLVEFQALNPKPIDTLTPAEARKQPTLADAAKKVLEKKGKSTAPIAMAKVENKKITGAAGPIDARIYTPKIDAKKPLPVVVYYHGGGFAIASLDVYDASARGIAKEASAIVVAADYRRAPEDKFPAAHEDAFAAYQWALKNAASFGGDPQRIAVAGESAGGNLAINVSIMARDKNVPTPRHQLLVYPLAQTSMDTQSYREWSTATPLNKAMMGWFVTQYTRSPADAQDTRLNVVAANLRGLPKTTIVLAEIDPLRSDGEILADKLEKAGVDVAKKTYEGVTHEFFGLGAVVDDAKNAVDYAGDRLESDLK